MQSEYTFTRTIISGGRVTVPSDVLKEFGFSDGDKLVVTFKKPVKEIIGRVI